MRSLLLFTALSLVAFTAAAQDASCFNYGKPCPVHSPFCSGRLQKCSSYIWDGFLENLCIANASQPNACVSMPGCKSFHIDFNSPKDVPRLDQYNGNPDKSPFVDDTGNTEIKNGALLLNMRWTGPGGSLTRVTSTRQFHYGTYSARLRLSSGKGFVYTWIFKTSADSDTHGDEIDWEFVPGKDDKRVESNYYVNGVLDHTNARSHLLPKSLDQWQTYTFTYMPNNLMWHIDDLLVRNVSTNAHIQTPRSTGQLFLSIWDTCGLAPGTVQWATGGNGSNAWCNTASPDLQRLVYRMAVDWVDVTCANGYDDTTPVQVPRVGMGEANRNAIPSNDAKSYVYPWALISWVIFFWSLAFCLLCNFNIP